MQFMRSIDPRASTYKIACWRRRGSTDCIRRYRVVGYVFSAAWVRERLLRVRRLFSAGERRTVNNVMHGADAIYFALFAAFVSAPPRYVTFRDRRGPQYNCRIARLNRAAAGNIWRALAEFSYREFPPNGSRSGDEKFGPRDSMKKGVCLNR